MSSRADVVVVPRAVADLTVEFLSMAYPREPAKQIQLLRLIATFQNPTTLDLPDALPPNQ
jgi:DNA-binding transcriptional MocR family regulator